MNTYILSVKILKNTLVVLLVFFSTMPHLASAQTLDEQGSQLRKMRDILAANPDTLTTSEKKELVKTLDEKLSEIGTAIAVTKNFTEWPQILREIVDLLSLPDSETKHVETKLTVFAEWADATKQMIKVLHPDDRPRIAPQADMPSRTIVEFSGSGNLTTRPFTVPNGWEIQWSYKNTGNPGGIGIFSMILYHDTGEVIDVITNQMNSGQSSVYRAKGGRYYLEIKAMGDWKVKVIDAGS